MKRVWIEPGCIICRICEEQCPEVFLVTGETCLIREDAELGRDEPIRGAAQSCPVEVIRYEK